MLAKLMDTNQGLLSEMLSAGCITWRQKEYIETAVAVTDRNERVLDILLRGSDLDFNKLLSCLIRSGQAHIANILSQDAAVGSIEAETETMQMKII